MSSPIPVRHLRDEPCKPITRLATDTPEPASAIDADSRAADTDETTLHLGVPKLLTHAKLSEAGQVIPGYIYMKF